MNAYIDNSKIQLQFDYDTTIIALVRDITGRRWNPDEKVWTLPFTSWHCTQVVEKLEPLGFTVSEEIHEKVNSSAPQPDLDIPAGLYPFQREAVEFLYSINGRAIIADEMGLGKTIEALAYVQLVSEKTLIISPATVLYKWENECKKWVPDKTVEVFPTGAGELTGTDIHIMSYGIMVSRYEQIKEEAYDTVIFDESHLIKNGKAMRTRVAKALVKMGIPHILFLSGTPFMNRPGELFTMLNMLDPKGFSNYYQYAQRYCGAIYDGGMWYFPPNGISNTEELVQRLNYLMIRRTKQDVLHDLPELTRSSLPVKIKRTEYEKARRDVREWLKGQDRELINPEHALTKLNVLRQIVGKEKVEAAVELAESVLQDGKKVVLFAHHHDVVDMLKEKLKAYKVGIISGNVTAKKRQKTIELFQDSNQDLSSDSSLQVMIITTAGAEGIDLFAASDIIFVEREWTPAKEEQAESRLHRNGQTNPVNAWYIVATNTVDEKLDRMVRDKRKIFGQVIRTDEIVEHLLDTL